MKQLYTIMQKIIIHDFNSYFRQSTWECSDCQEYIAQFHLHGDLDIGKILFASSFIKQLKVNGKSIERKVFPSIL